ncbi:adenylyltransferase/cytidyltransferase family protein [Candidatus Uhrbacteria bacterium]|jgi:FAD synthetase|nr:adenylyltransferase/cytidyltransferase family protein [Candidatus Uhrbacteria bacterium]
MKSVAVFGAFDILHPGHKAFLNQAAALGDKLTVYLALDEIIVELKGREPVQEFKVRKAALEALTDVDEVQKGDHVLGNYRGISISQPDAIVLGYDQGELEKDLKRWMKKFRIEIPIIHTESFHPETYKTSKLRENI